jgi:hypothetical protein
MSAPLSLNVHTVWFLVHQKVLTIACTTLSWFLQSQDFNATAHPPLDMQLEIFGVRAIHLQMVHSSAYQLSDSSTEARFLSYASNAADRTFWCDSLPECLTIIQSWIKKHEYKTLPVVVQVELLTTTSEESVSQEYMNTLLTDFDHEVKTVFSESELFTPNELSRELTQKKICFFIIDKIASICFVYKPFPLCIHQCRIQR